MDILAGVSLIRFIATQVLGAASVGVFSWGLAQKDKPHRVHVSQIIGNALCAAQCLCAGRPGAIPGAAVYTVSALRSTFFTYDKKNAIQKISTLAVFSGVTVLAGLLTWKGLVSLLPVFAGVAITYGQWQGNKNPTRMRKTIVAANVALIAFNIFNGLWADMVGRMVTTAFGAAKLMHESKITKAKDVAINVQINKTCDERKQTISKRKIISYIRNLPKRTNNKPSNGEIRKGAHRASGRHHS